MISAIILKRLAGLAEGLNLNSSRKIAFIPKKKKNLSYIPKMDIPSIYFDIDPI